MGNHPDFPQLWRSFRGSPPSLRQRTTSSGTPGEFREVRSLTRRPKPRVFHAPFVLAAYMEPPSLQQGKQHVTRALRKPRNVALPAARASFPCDQSAYCAPVLFTSGDVNLSRGPLCLNDSTHPLFPDNGGNLMQQCWDLCPTISRLNSRHMIRLACTSTIRVCVNT